MFVNRSAVEEHTTNAAKEVMESLTAELNLLKTKVFVCVCVCVCVCARACVRVCARGLNFMSLHQIQACKQAANNKPYKCNEELMALRPALVYQFAHYVPACCSDISRCDYVFCQPPKHGFCRWSNDEFRTAIEGENVLCLKTSSKLISYKPSFTIFQLQLHFLFHYLIKEM